MPLETWKNSQFCGFWTLEGQLLQIINSFVECSYYTKNYRKEDLTETESQMENVMKEKQENYNLAQEQLKQFGPTKQQDREYLDQKQEVAKLRYELNDEQGKVCVKQHLLKEVTEVLDKAGDDLPDVLDFSMDSDRQDDTSTMSSSSNHHSSALGGGLKKIKSLGGAFTKRSKSTVDEKSNVSSYEDNEISQSSNGPVSDSASASSSQFQSNGSLPLEEEEWFHGVLPREEVQRLLCNDGDFLVRESKNRKTNETQYVLSAFWQGHRHFIIQYSDHEGWRFEGRPFPTIGELVRHQHKSGEPVTTKSKTILKSPILREQWQLRNDDISLEMKIGNGNFGEVYKGVYKPKNLVVAVKTCRDTLSDDQRKKFLQEGRILKQYDHENIVRFIGIAAQRQPVMIVMEYVAGGALLGFLRKNGKAQTKKQLTKMCEDAGSGMAYLESKNCIHRDLAARNCLVGDQSVVKISDFGMSREEEEYTVSDGLKQIPIKWTAPEALMYGKYTSLCDVWSFGILMWEVFSSGQTPYPGQTNNQAREKIDAGYRMPAPEGTPPTCYDLMLKCWEKNPADRPHFAGIVKELKSIGKKL
ncbi:hypothetical protein FSP39_008824 [Pinctada imbricata]|uniref:Tyrosine-protein kinase n=1 Tax=Pinctada imbricata TaxID=66713 RepID=A0AA88Y606_PINIB|nr:hypothetical protein FSP39_008824 [Pinctada imbricata]